MSALFLIASEFTFGESIAFVVLVVLAIAGAVKRRNRRALMTPTELASDDLREEMARLRREMRRHR